MRASLLWLLVSLALLPSPAAAARRRAAVVGVDSGSAQAQATGTVTRVLEDTLRGEAGLEWVDLTRVAAPDVAEQRRQALEQGKHALLKATQLFEEQKADAAQEQLGRAILRLEESDLEQALPSLFEALNLSALVAQRQGKPQEARARLEHAFTLRPEHVVDPTRVTPAFAELAAEARARVEAAGRGTLGLRTTPPGAAAYVDGRFVGLTPLEVQDLRQGPHYVTVKLPGYTPAQERLQVEATSRVSLPLQMALRGAELQTRLVAVEAAFADELERPRAIQALASWAELDEVWLARVESREGGQLVRVFRLDASGRPLVEAEQTLGRNALGKPDALEPILRSLLGPSRPGDGREGISSRSTPSGPPLSSRKKWALAAAGTGVALAAGGLFLGLRANSQAADARALETGDPRAHEEAASRAERTALYADLCWVGAVAGAATGAVLWFTGGEPGVGDGRTGSGGGDLRWSVGPFRDGLAAAVAGTF